MKEAITPTNTGLVTVVMNGTTYTSPIVYISFDTVRMFYPMVAVGPINYSVYETHNVEISVDSKSISS